MADKPRDPRISKETEESALIPPEPAEEPALISPELPEEPAEPNRVLMILRCGCTLPQPNPIASAAYCARHKALVSVATYTYLEITDVAA